jgi:predicted fused transcriptional regulator/phosphomethylpyrimidine kinase
VRTNVAISKKNAVNLNEIAAVDGRITVVAGKPIASGPIRFGASNHTGRLLLKAKQLDNEINAVINIKFDPDTIKKLKDSHFSMVSIDRLKSKTEIRIKERSSMGWIVQEAHKQLNKIPDIIWDSGEPEKEPMIRLFAKDASDLINKLKIFLNLE